MKKQILILAQILVIQFHAIHTQASRWEIVCPGDVTVSCADLQYDYNFYYGRAYTLFNDNRQYIHDCKVITALNDCGVGYIKRVWGAVNPENNEWVTCTQVITVVAQGSFGYNDITWPPSIEIKACDPAAELKKLGKPYDRPYWAATRCAKPMYGYSDTRYRINGGCEKIVREWKVIDWCVYHPQTAPNRGVFTATQVIKLIADDTTAHLSCKKEITVKNDRTCDKTFVAVDKAVFQSVCNLPHVIKNTSPYSNSKGDDASGEYPIGTTRFYYIAEYGCGYETKCEVVVHVLPGVPPTPYCHSGLISTLMPVDADKNGVPEDGMVEIWAQDLNLASFHICPKRALSYSFSKDVPQPSRIFSCKDLGVHEVELWVRDQFGNQDVCKTKITIQNNNPSIPHCTDSVSVGKKTYRILEGTSVNFGLGGASGSGSIYIFGGRSSDAALDQLHVFPSPLAPGQDLRLTFYSPCEDEAVLRIFKMDAGAVFASHIALTKGYNQQILSITNWPSGIYFVEIRTRLGKHTAKFIVV